MMRAFHSFFFVQISEDFLFFHVRVHYIAFQVFGTNQKKKNYHRPITENRHNDINV